MSNERGCDFLLSRIDEFDDTYTPGNSQEGILGYFVASPCTNTKFILHPAASLSAISSGQ
jgi:hypothetical protein